VIYATQANPAGQTLSHCDRASKLLSDAAPSAAELTGAVEHPLLRNQLILSDKC
jgi:hypothetical protein